MALLRLLGPPLLDGGRPLPADRRGCLLAYLAHSGEWMSRDRLAWLFWPDTDQASARRNLRQLISRTRQLDLPAELELTKDLARWRVESDLERFRRAVSRKEWLAALEQYTGDFLLDFAVDEAGTFGEWLAGERESVRDVYREAALRGATELEAKGRYEEACRHLGDLLESDPLAEDVVQRYLQNLYLSGRREGALAAYERFARQLRDELGLEPLQETRDIQSIIQKAVPLAVDQRTKPAGPTVPLDILRPSRLIGREEAHSTIAAAATPLVLVEGEAGIGKSRLLEELAPAAPMLRCREGLRAVPYQPVVAFVRERIGQAAAIPHVGPFREDISRLLPELGSPQSSAIAEDDVGKSRLMEALARLLEEWPREGTARGFDLVIDDLQWADSGTLELLTFIAHRGKVRVVAALRDHDVEKGVLEVVRGLRSAGVLTEVKLHPLAVTDLQVLLEQFDASPGSRAFATWLHSQSGGNIMFALETVRSIYATGGGSERRLSWQELADSMMSDQPKVSPAISEVIARRVGRLDEATVRTLEAAAVVGQDFDANTLSRICGMSEWAVSEALVEAEAAGLVADRGFRHDLLRQSVYETIPASRRALLHGRALDTLQQAYRSPGSALLVRHAQAAGRVEELVLHSLAAGNEALALPAYRNAAHHFRTVLENRPPGEARSLALEGLGDALVQLWQGEEARAAYEQALEDDQVRLDPPRFARLKRKLYLALARLSQADEAILNLRQAREQLESHRDEGSTSWRHEWIELLLAETSHWYAANELGRMAEDLELLEPTAESYGNPSQRSRFYARQGMLRSRLERYRISVRTLGIGRKAVDAIAERGREKLLAGQRFSLGFLALWHGDTDLALENLQAAVRFGDEREDATLQMQAGTYLSILHRQLREIDACRVQVERCLELTRRHRKTDYHAVALANLAWLAVLAGTKREAAEQAREALRLWQSLTSIRYPFYWLACCPLLALAVDGGDLSSAAEQAELLLQPSQLALPDELDEALRCGLVAWNRQDQATAARHFEASVALARKHRFL